MRTFLLLSRLGLSCLFLSLVLPCLRADDPAQDLNKEALSLNSVLGDTAMQEKLDELQKDSARTKKLLAAALALHRQKDTTFNYSASLVLAMAAKEVKDLDTAVPFFRRAIAKAEEMKSDRRLATAYFHFINLYIEHKKFTEAEKVCKQVLEMQRAPEDDNDEKTLQNAKMMALRRMVMISALQGKLEQAEKTLKPFLEENPPELEALETQVWLLRFQEKYAEAIKVYERILTLIPAGNQFDKYRDEYRQHIGSLYGELDNLDKAMEYLLPLLKKNPDDPGLNNDIGYMWAEHDRNMDEAARMIRIAVDKEPDNPSYLDSLGWVLFKQKQYAEAKKHLLKAISFPRGNNTEILDHLGDVHAALGEKTEAAAAWKKAAAAATPSQRDQKRKAKIEEKIKQLEQ
jgi:tetratricopeptide (TPR) repeat protein